MRIQEAGEAGSGGMGRVKEVEGACIASCPFVSTILSQNRACPPVSLPQPIFLDRH